VVTAGSAGEGGNRLAPASGVRRSLPRTLAVAQGLYFLAIGLWPLVDLRSFMAVTGPKTDGWLVKTVGVLVAVIGAGLLLAARRRGPAPETVLTAVGAAAGLAAVDVTYTLRGRLAGIYLLDAVLEGVLLAAWAAATAPPVMARSRRRREPGRG